jgi:hypothetical protein
MDGPANHRVLQYEAREGRASISVGGLRSEVRISDSAFLLARVSLCYSKKSPPGGDGLATTPYYGCLVQWLTVSFIWWVCNIYFYWRGFKPRASHFFLTLAEYWHIL